MSARVRVLVVAPLLVVRSSARTSSAVSPGRIPLPSSPLLPFRVGTGWEQEGPRRPEVGGCRDEPKGPSQRCFSSQPEMPREPARVLMILVSQVRVLPRPSGRSLTCRFKGPNSSRQMTTTSPRAASAYSSRTGSLGFEVGVVGTLARSSGRCRPRPRPVPHRDARRG
jgi:hypothetical protein